MHKTLLVSTVLMASAFQEATAQTRSISGRVTDRQTGEGLPGVTVLLKGTSNGISTNSDGTYALSNVPATGGTLVFSSIGYITIERAIGTEDAINVGLATDTKQLSEVVVTALGIQRESRALGYAISEVKSEQVVQKSEPDVLRTLQGKVAGVNIIGANGAPGSATRITIRGNTSLINENQPLFVVDGVPYDNRQTNSDNSLTRGSSYSNRFADIDPNNIESMTVLKGLAAAALYGNRAANGVIVITTKTGSGKRGDKGVRVGYNSSYSIERIANLPEYQNKYGSGANFTYSAANGSWGPAFGGELTEVPHPYAGLSNVFPQFAGATYPYKAFENNVKDFFDTGKLFENSINITGTGENTTFAAVLTRSDQQGMIPETKFNRTSLSAGGSGQFDKLRVGANITYTNTDQRGPQLGANNAIGNASAFGRTLFIPRNLDLTGLPYENPVTRASLLGWLTNQADNPYWSTQYNSYTSRVDRNAISANVSYDITKWLSASFVGGLNTYTDKRRSVLRPGSVGAGGLGEIIQDNILNTELEGTALLTANKNLTEDISLKAVVGYNVNQRQFELESVIGSNYILFDIDNITNTRNVAQNSTAQTFSPFQKRRLYGVLGDVTLGYKDFVYLNATARNEWSSTLAADNRSYFFPSVSGSVIFTEALGIQSDVLNLGKIRAGYAKAGRDANPYIITSRFTINPFFGNNAGGTGFPFNGLPGAAIGGAIGNPALTPEFSNEFEVGTDLTFLKDRIALGATYYDKRSTSQIANVPLPFATGFTSLVTNFGEISNKGFEGTLTLVPVDAGGFRWTSFTAFTRNRNIVERLDAGIEQLLLPGNFFADPQAVHRPGQQYGQILGSVAARDPQSGKVLINPATGTIIRSITPGIIGNPNPDYTFGFTNTFTYKGITLEGIVDFRKGGDVYSTSVASMLGRGVTKDTEDREKTLVIDGVYGNPNTQQPILDSEGRTTANTTAISLNDYYFGAGAVALSGPSEFSVFDGTTVRLREVTLGYSLPASILQKTPFRGLTLSLSGRNLYWFSPNIPKYTNFDPETNTYGASNAQGFEYTNAPTARRFGVNLRVNF